MENLNHYHIFLITPVILILILILIVTAGQHENIKIKKTLAMKNIKYTIHDSFDFWKNVNIWSAITSQSRKQKPLKAFKFNLKHTTIYKTIRTTT